VEATASRWSSRPPEFDLDQLAPVTAWAEVAGYLKREWRQGEHFAILGPTGSGKTFAALEVAEIRTYVIVVACKPRDPLIQDALARGYWLVPTDRLEIPYSDGRPLHPKVVYWPRLTDKQRRALPPSQVMRAEKGMQKPRVAGAIGYVRNAGHWTLLLDETTWVCRDLRLQEDVDSALFQFRSLDSSIILLAQRPSWIGRFALSSPRFLILFQTNDDNDRKALGEISSVDTNAVRAAVGELDFGRHECLLIDTYARRMWRTVVESERGRG
jgi:hypothetical protein